jgi:DNA-binding CsgD family transcriptional regulator
MCRRCSQIPTDDIDEMAVERLVIGQPVNATPAERRQAVAYLTRRKLSAAEIARRIGCTQRTVVRHRSRLAS